MFELAHLVFDGILEVRQKTSWWWTLGRTWDYINLRGLDNLMMDLAGQLSCRNWKKFQQGFNYGYVGVL